MGGRREDGVREGEARWGDVSGTRGGRAGRARGDLLCTIGRAARTSSNFWDWAPW